MIVSAPLCEVSETGVAFGVLLLRWARARGTGGADETLKTSTLVSKTVASDLRMYAPSVCICNGFNLNVTNNNSSVPDGQDHSRQRILSVAVEHPGHVLEKQRILQS